MAVGFRCGAAAMPAGELGMELTGLMIGFVPDAVQVSVRQPADEDADIITAYLAGEPTADGFSVIFSSPVPSEGYVLQWCATASSEQETRGDSLSVTYEELCEKVARFLGYNPANLTDAQRAEVDDYVQTGVRNFYFPPAMDGVDANFEWSFMRMVGGVTTQDGTGEYPLPDGFGRVAGTLRYMVADGASAPCRPIAVVSRSDIEAIRRHSHKGAPRAAAFVYVDNTFGERGQSMQMMLAPIPDAAYTLSFEADADTGRLSAERPFALGGYRFSELVVESCLAAAEQRANDEIGLHTQNFNSQLIAAIAKDRKTGAKAYGQMGIGSLRYDREIGIGRGHGHRNFPITYKERTW